MQQIMGFACLSSRYPGRLPTDLGGFKGPVFDGKTCVYKKRTADWVNTVTLDWDHFILAIEKTRYQHSSSVQHKDEILHGYALWWFILTGVGKLKGLEISPHQSKWITKVNSPLMKSCSILNVPQHDWSNYMQITETVSQWPFSGLYCCFSGLF